MKCLLFIFTLCSIGRFVNMQVENDADSDYTGDGPPEDVSESYEIADRQEESEQSDKDDNKNDETSSEAEGPILPQNIKLDNDKKSSQQTKAAIKLFISEMEAGDTADLIGQNQHIEQSSLYNDLGRRYEPQVLKNIEAENPDYLTPEKAPPELVLLVARESALLRAGKDTDLGNDFNRNKILRSGDYWNGVWKEEVNPKGAMRSDRKKKNLGSIKAKIKPGTEFFKVVSEMKKISPQLLYIINKKQI